MAQVNVERYQLAWRPQTNKGKVKLILDNGNTKDIDVDSAAELTAIAAILTRSTVGFDPNDDTLWSEEQPVGN
ncbi:MAG TPA: hypothetical protein VJP89_20375 [Pyrinomonadaceae bacterium]|nr:hypothetical protein [Pyrinomonadaceae bacterium]